MAAAAGGRGVALALSVALAACLPAHVGGRGNNCNGSFKCSEMTSEDPNLWKPGSSEECLYGHIEVNGQCSRPCNGVREAPCRCQTAEEAAAGVVDEAKTGMWISVGIIVVTCLAILYQLRLWMKARNAPLDIDESQGQATSDGGVVVMGKGADEAGNEAPAQRQMSRSQSALEAVRSTSDRLQKSSLARRVQWFLPLFAVGMLCYQCFKAATSGQPIQHKFGTFMPFVVLAALVVALSWAATERLAQGMKEGCDFTPSLSWLEVFGRAFRLAIALGPAIGVAGIVWSVHRQNNPEGVYKTC